MMSSGSAWSTASRAWSGVRPMPLAAMRWTSCGIMLQFLSLGGLLAGTAAGTFDDVQSLIGWTGELETDLVERIGLRLVELGRLRSEILDRCQLVRDLHQRALERDLKRA